MANDKQTDEELKAIAEKIAVECLEMWYRERVKYIFRKLVAVRDHHD